MNRLTNEQRLQIIEFYYQNASSVVRDIVPKVRTKFTLLDIKPATRLHRVLVLMMTLNYRIVHNAEFLEN